MMKRSLMMMIVALLSLTPAALASADAADLHGSWDMTSYAAGGQSEDVPAGAFTIEFLADGTVKMYEEGNETDSGTYAVNGDQITLTTNNDGEAPPATYSVDGDTLTVEMEPQPGMVFTMTFSRGD